MASRIWFLVILVTLAESRIDTENVSLSLEAQLVHDLLKRYEKLGVYNRPLHNMTQPIHVLFGLRLITLEVDEMTQTLTTSVWVRQKWFDEYLTWDPEEYGGVTHVILPHASVWMPENIALVNTATTDRDEVKVELQVKHTGQVFYVPHTVYKSGCLIDLTDYPYDIQTCDLWIQSVSRYRWHLKLDPYLPSSLDLDTYRGSFKEAKEWEVIGNSTEFIAKPRSQGAILMYSMRGALKFTLVVRRRFGFMSVLFQLPCVSLAMIVPLIFCLPTERADRHMLGKGHVAADIWIIGKVTCVPAMSLFTSFIILLLILTTKAPPSAASVPKLGMYYCFNLILIIVSIFTSVFILCVGRQSQRPPPVWMQKLFLCVLARVVCVKKHTRQPGTIDTQESGSAGTTSITENRSTGTTGNNENGAAGPTTQRPTELVQVRPEEIEKWKTISTIMDRLAALLFLLTNIVACFVLLPRPSERYLQ